MVLTAAQRTAFFSQQMSFQAATIAHLVTEGIEEVSDLGEFDNDTFEQIASNCRRPPGGSVALVFVAKSLKRLVVATHLIKYYKMIGRVLTAPNIVWDPVIKNFEIQWKAVQELKNGDEPEVPTLTGTTVIRWN